MQASRLAPGGGAGAGGQGGDEGLDDALGEFDREISRGKDLGPDAAAATVAVEGCDDQDRAARQLCEAATQEDDPFLRAAHWDEYNEYKKIAAR